jgi:ABC-type phosphate/phosphonate transport system substrate-binding protein
MEKTKDTKIEKLKKQIVKLKNEIKEKDDKIERMYSMSEYEVMKDKLKKEIRDLEYKNSVLSRFEIDAEQTIAYLK